MINSPKDEDPQISYTCCHFSHSINERASI